MARHLAIRNPLRIGPGEHARSPVGHRKVQGQRLSFLRWSSAAPAVARSGPGEAVLLSLFGSRLVALALDKEGLHILVLQDLHGRLLGSVTLRDCEERLLRLRHHRAREVVLVDRVVLGRHGPVQQWHDVAKDARRVGVAENHGGTVTRQGSRT